MKKIVLGLFIIFGLLIQGVYAEEEYANSLWSHNLRGNVWGVMHGDFTGDGVPEVVVASGCCANPGYVTVFDVSGNIIWQAKIPNEIRVIDIGDITGDGKLDAVVSATDRKVYFVSNSGEIINVYTDSSMVDAIKIVDLDGDGKNEVVTASTNIRIFKNMEEVASYRTANRVLDLHFYDLTNDNKLEIVSGGLGNFVYVLRFDNELELLWRDSHNAVIWGTLPFEYMGEKSVLVLTRGAYVLDGDGEKIFQIDDNNYFVRGYDSGNMLLIADDKGSLKSYDHYLNELWSFNTGREIKDIKSYRDQGKNYIILGSMDNNVYLLKDDGALVQSLEARSYVSSVDTFTVRNRRYIVYGSFDDNVYTYYRESKNVSLYGFGTLLAGLLYLLYKKRQ